MTTSYCDIKNPVYASSEATIDWLEENDPAFLRSVVTENEKWAALCPDSN